MPTSGGLTQARQRLGWEVLAGVLERVAVPVAQEVTAGAFLGRWRLMAIDGTEWDVPDTDLNAAEFGYRRGGSQGVRAAFPKARLVTITEVASHATVAAVIGGKGAGERTLARSLFPVLEEDWLLIADRNFYGWADWQAAAGTGAALLWRVISTVRLPVLRDLPDGSYLTVLIDPKVRDQARRAALIAAAGRDEDPDPDIACLARVIEYDVPGRGSGERITLVTTITSPAQATAADLAAAYHQRWEHETGNAQLKTTLRGPGRVLRSRSPDMVRQEIYGYLLTHYAISALITAAATKAGLDPGRIRFTRTVRIIRRHATAAFPP